MRSIPPQSGGRVPGVRFRRPPQEAEAPEQFQRLQASALYCPKCKQATPTREFLLLVLPDGDLYDYRCAHCGTSTGSRTEKKAVDVQVFPG
jgi:hypothetical protein